MIAISGLTKIFHRGSINEVEALQDIHLAIERGDFVTIIGSNGAGKSTFLNCLAGTYVQDSGQILINGRDVAKWPEHQRAKFISRVFQDPLMGTCESLSIEQNLAIAHKRGQMRGIGIGVKDKDRDVFRQKLSILNLGLDRRLKDRVGLLSGGQRQALTMVMATMGHPDILLLDEHTAALDPKTAIQIQDLTCQMVSSLKLTTLMVTHNMNQALQMGNRLVMMHRGAVIMDIRGEEKARLTVKDLLQRFFKAQGEELSSDKMLLD
jgi:putative ABC transport system ATP-binding protein